MPHSDRREGRGEYALGTVISCTYTDRLIDWYAEEKFTQPELMNTVQYSVQYAVCSMYGGRGRGPPTKPSVQLSLLKKIHKQYML
jgi:hypothetical protein